MQIDNQTFVDIDFFLSDESICVFDFIDKTITSEGKSKLRNIFTSPPNNFAKLKARQRVIQRLTLQTDTLKLPLKEYQLKSIQEYLDSNINIITGESLFENTLFYLKDKQAFRYLKYCVYDAANLILGLNHFFELNKDIFYELFPDTYNELDKIVNNSYLSHSGYFKTKNALRVTRTLKLDYIIRKSFNKSISSLIDTYYQIDALFAMAKSTKENNFSFPELIEEGSKMIYAQDIYHPLIPNAIPASIKIEENSNLLFLTGPNMSGKSTFIKAIGISVLFAHAGMGVPAKNMTLSYFDRLFTSINISDKTLNHESYFLSEVRRVKVLATALNRGERVIALCDELFKGTNVKDAYSASTLVITALSKWQNSAFIISTHLYEIWSKIKHIQNITCVNFESSIERGIPIFSYNLTEGINKTRLGLQILKNENILELLNSNKN